MNQELSRTNQKKQQKQGAKRRYITGIDGLRSLAVIGVIVFHLAPSSLKGGFLGVPIFLVLAGYLVTYFMILDWDKDRSLHIGSFIKRRISRLYPTLVTVLVGTTAYITLFERQLLTNIRGTILTNLTFVYNWFEINHGQSYFDRAMGESPFTHLWTLSLEGQFYIIWPFVMLILLKLFKNRVIPGIILFAGSVISAVEMALIYDPGNVNRVYYGTDTRFFALLLGASLAFLWPMNHLSNNVSKSNRRWLDGIGLFAIVAMVIAYFTLSGSDTSVYQWGMYVFSAVATLLVAMIVHPASHWNAWLTNKLFTYIGKRSYGIYVYQFPVMIFYENKVKSIGDHPVINAIIQIAIILLISEISYRYIEKPLRNFKWSQLKENNGKSYLSVKNIARLTGVFALVALTTVGLVQQPQKTTGSSLQKVINSRSKKANKANAKAIKLQKQQAKAAAEYSHNQALEKREMQHLSKTQRENMKTYQLSARDIVTLKQTPLTSVGDSVMIDVSTSIQDVFPAATVNGKVGRQAAEVMPVLNSLESNGQLSKNVLLNIGTNGTVTKDQVEEILDFLGKDRDVYWTTAYVPNRSWQQQVNSTLYAEAKKHSNLHIIDWYGTAKNHPTSWFTTDGIHPNNVGVTHFAGLVAKSIAKDKETNAN